MPIKNFGGEGFQPGPGTEISVREPEVVIPEVVTKEGVAALKRFNQLLYGELGRLDVPKLREAFNETVDHEVVVDWQSEFVQARFRDEIKFLLGWRPKSDEPAIWIGFDKDAVPPGPDGQETMRIVHRSMMRTLAASIPRPQELDQIQILIDFIEARGVNLNGQDQGLVQVFDEALFNHKYIGELSHFIALAERLGVELSKNYLAYALEDEVTNGFNGIRGIDSESLKYAEEMLELAKAKGVELDLGKNEVFESALLRVVCLELTSWAFEIAQDVFDFCQKYEIKIDAQKYSSDSRDGINGVLRDLAHEARQNLNLESLQAIIDFCKKNNLHPDLPEEMLARWQTDIPKLKKARAERRQWGF
ncbi:MAG: hypothetical protein UX09_C0053G0004 [Candidatus Uhrbacteria bacterium GW2011_GWE2_45_35]|uniref:Uncharacterized protein n=2 Tax=Candidatus Uhriibacteriota TaxID=1752732 RepID=A0A0G1JD22_9BACT|nr:MAG: hypothetical protein UW63_C0055G0004 [Candidatus Uhrbacteria bacterium GW2011_GWF2_44_350]KKU06398.1 MAG: hypothetical protein UX09_C0053G0004 [Candidatus Uhrbacteria bacterium GW2011_GWE2_45_35]HCU31482.1 hypothetical protein [Candidatus Uhrbacteria bacterium]